MCSLNTFRCYLYRLQPAERTANLVSIVQDKNGGNLSHEVHKTVKGPICDPQPHPPILLQKGWDFYIIKTF